MNRHQIRISMIQTLSVFLLFSMAACDDSPHPLDGPVEGTIHVSDDIDAGRIKVGLFDISQIFYGWSDQAQQSVLICYDSYEPGCEFAPVALGNIIAEDDRLTYLLELPERAEVGNQFQVVAWLDENDDGLMKLLPVGEYVCPYVGEIEMSRLPQYEPGAYVHWIARWMGGEGEDDNFHWTVLKVVESVPCGGSEAEQIYSDVHDKGWDFTF